MIRKRAKGVPKSKLKVAQMVEYILKEYPITRNSDPWLIGHVYQRFYGIQMDKCTVYEMLSRIAKENLPNFESIRRCRSKLQTANKLLAPLDVEVLEERGRKPVRNPVKRWW